MDILVEFTGEVGARIVKDPRIIAEKIGKDNVLLNPDTKHLQGISPSFWVKNGDLIEAISPESAHKMVFEGEIHSGDYSPGARLSVDAKMQKMRQEIDAKRDEDIHNVLKTLKLHKSELEVEMKDLEARIDASIAPTLKELKTRQRKIELLSFLYLIAMILIKFL